MPSGGRNTRSSDAIRWPQHALFRGRWTMTISRECRGDRPRGNPRAVSVEDGDGPVPANWPRDLAGSGRGESLLGRRSGGALDPHGALLFWGWAELVANTNIPRRTIERQLAAGRFPEPARRVGRRPFWRPADVIRWAEGGEL